MNTNLSYVTFKIKPKGDYKSARPFSFRPIMINPDSTSNYQKIYTTPKGVITNNLLKKAGLTNNPRKIFTSITDFGELMKFVAKTKYWEKKEKASDPSGVTIPTATADKNLTIKTPPPSEQKDNILKNIEFLKKIYFAKKQKFYPVRSIKKTNKQNLEEEYNIGKAEIKDIYREKNEEDNIYVYIVNLELSLVKGEKLSKIDYYKLECKEKAKWLDAEASKLFDISLNLYKEPKPVKKRKVTKLFYSGQEKKELPLYYGRRLDNSKERAAVDMVLKKQLEELAKKYNIEPDKTNEKTAIKLNSVLPRNFLEPKEKRVIDYYINIYKQKNRLQKSKSKNSNFEIELLALANKYNIKPSKTNEQTAIKLNTVLPSNILEPKEKEVIDYYIDLYRKNNKKNETKKSKRKKNKTKKNKKK